MLRFGEARYTRRAARRQLPARLNCQSEWSQERELLATARERLKTEILEVPQEDRLRLMQLSRRPGRGLAQSMPLGREDEADTTLALSGSCSLSPIR